MVGNASKSGFISNVATVLGGQAACALLGLVTEICYARLLGPIGRGQISICMLMISVGVLIGGLGGDVPIVIWAADSRRKITEWLPASLVWGLTGCVFAGAVWMATYWWWHPPWLTDISRSLATIVLATLPVTVFAAFFSAALAGKERFRSRAGVALADQAAALLGFLALLLFWGRKSETAVAGNLIGLVVGLALNVVLLKDLFTERWRPHWSQPWIQSGFMMGLRGQLGNFASLLYYRLDVLFVNYFLGSASVGLYALGVAVSEALWQIPSAVAAALFPRTARTRSENEGADEFTCLIMRQVFVISCVMGLLLALASPVAIPLVFGQRFGASVAVVWWLLPGTIGLSLAKVACADLAGRHKNGYSSICAMAALGVTVVLDWLLIPRMGIQGAALASSVAYITDGGLLLLALRYELKVSWTMLLVPSRAELDTYRNLWLRYVPGLWTALISARGSEPSA